MNLHEAKEILKKKGYTVRRLNECGSSSCGGGGGCSGLRSFRTSCGSSMDYGSSSSGGCGGIRRTFRSSGCGGFVSSCFSSGCGSSSVERPVKSTRPNSTLDANKITRVGINDFYGCYEYKNDNTGKPIFCPTINQPGKFKKILDLAAKFKTKPAVIIEIIETLYDVGIKREVTYELLKQSQGLPASVLNPVLTHII